MTVSFLRATIGIVAVAVVAVSVVYGLTRAGSPRDERSRRLDERRIEDLRGIGQAVDLHWTRYGSLPASLHELSAAAVQDVALNDPERGEPYEYQVRAATAFELCGVFRTDWSEPSVEQFWAHPIGRHCFDLEVREVRRQDADREGTTETPRARR